MNKMTIVLCAALLCAPAANRLSAEGGIGLGMGDPGLYRAGDSWTSTYENPFHDYVVPLMMDLPNVIDQYLNYKKELGLTPDQQRALKDLRRGYQAEIVRLDSDLNIELMNLHDLMMEDDVDMLLIQSQNQKVESLQSQIRTKNIALFYSARKLLTADQLKTAVGLGIKPNPYEYYGYHWAMGF